MRSHLKLVQYTPPAGEHPRVCAAIWKRGRHVCLVSPLLRLRNGVLDPLPIQRQFGDAICALDAFVDTMQWLDAACFAASDPREVQRACEGNPDWRLSCVRFDGSDEALCGAATLLRAVLDKPAWKSLQDAFAQILSASKDETP